MTTIYKQIASDLLNLTQPTKNCLPARLIVVGLKFSKLFLVLLTLAVCATSLLAQGGKPAQAASNQPVYFNANAREVIQPGALAADKVSATSIGDVLTLLFDGAKLSLQNDSDPLTAIWAGTIRIPTNAKTHAYASYLQHVRGAVTKDERSRVSLIFNLGGKTFIKEYGYGMKSSGDILLQFVSPIRPRPARSYTATLVILVDRGDPKSAVLVNVDSVDVEARSAGSRKKKSNKK